ncbi:GNAT family N-acetyltransferase [Rhodococcus sp. MEB064]|uniref:GNAT family N-acetyltransferase n=1 Tax=Rhodococcus sp. MEB064 TaxID=1587522 RepID=UPI000AD97A8C|nr:GNAT family N-acetyltransferase [Rhodococcus sp. MEB064]
MDDAPALRTVSTDELSDADTHACEGLVRGAFGEHFTPHDWIHALGGVHAVLTVGDRVIGHAAVVPRLLAHDGKEFDGGFVEAVALDPEFRGTGQGAAVMEAIEAEIESSDVLGVLNSLPEAVGFYEARGWVRWRGLLGGIGNFDDPTPPDDQDTVMVFHPPAHIDVDGVLLVNNRVGSRW